ncbi:MAG: LacI family DNA-binding transcriptional regulator [Clostridia bacterium]|nr:LacI family DNA-binding transcriptional regulator [Clostridia bacterium]
MATIGDVAKHAGVSTTLVSRYLNGVKGVSPASKEKIESAIRELQYVPDESARMLVRRRGGGSAAPASDASLKSALPQAIAMVCEDADFQLIASLYLGAKHTVWGDVSCKGYQILLFVIPEGEIRSLDEDETIDYIRRTCKAVIGVAEDGDAFREKLRSLALPMAFLSGNKESKTIHRGSAELVSVQTELEQISTRIVKTLCAAAAANETPLADEILPCSLKITDEQQNSDHSPIGRTLQSHLL